MFLVPLSKNWRQKLRTIDQEWVSAAMFSTDHLGKHRVDFAKVRSMWLTPPQPPLQPNALPKLDQYFGQKLCLWMPVKFWGLQIACPHDDCSCQQLSYSGVHPTVRQVLNILEVIALD